MKLVTITSIIVVLASPAIAADQTTELERLGLEQLASDEDYGYNPRAAGEAIIAAEVVLQEGDTTAGVGGVVTSLNQPFINGAGDAGFTGAAAENFVWSGGVVWINSDGLPAVLTGAEFTMGIGDGGAFIYSPSTDGADSVWTEDGMLAVENVQAPGMPTGTLSTFHSRPTMIPSGQAYWVAGHGDGSGGTSSVGRILYTSTDGTPANISIIFRTGDTIDSQIIDSSGVDFDYDFSDNGAHHAHVLDMVGSTAADGFLYVDGALVAREGDPNGSGVDNWDNFDFVSINDSGSYVFSGDTDGATDSDEFIAANGEILIREGDTIDDVLLAPGFAVRGVGINNANEAVYGWGSSTTEHLFYACDASDPAATSTLLLSTGDQLDLDGNGTGDATVTDLPAGSVHNFQLGDTGVFYIEADLDYGAGEVNAIIALDVGICSLFSDGFESGDTSGWSSAVP